MLDKLGAWTYFRMNHLYPPFDNKLLRQAAIAAVSRKDVLKALVGSPKYRTCAAVMGCGNPMGDNYGEDWVVPARIDRARRCSRRPAMTARPWSSCSRPTSPWSRRSQWWWARRLKPASGGDEAMDWQEAWCRSRATRNRRPTAAGCIFSTYSILAPAAIRSATPRWRPTPEPGRTGRTCRDRGPAPEVRPRPPTSPAQSPRRSRSWPSTRGVVAPLGQFRFRRAYSKSCRACWTRRSLCSGISGSGSPKRCALPQSARSGPANRIRGGEATLPRMATIKELPRMMTLKETACPPSMTC